MNILYRLKISYLFNKRKLFLFSIFSFLLFIIFSFLLFEIIFSFFSDSEDRKRNREINNFHFSCASQNKFGFNDINHNPYKNNDSFRIIVMGDSFIWGDGVLKDDIWSRKLEKKLKRKYKLEVLHWGIPGWSTLDQYTFLKENFLHDKTIYEADLIIFGFLENDLETSPKYNKKRISICKVLKSQWLSEVFPHMTEFIDSFLYDFFSKFPISDIGHTSYLRRLTSEENLQEYSKILTDLKYFLDNKNIKFFFVSTPYASKEYIPLNKAIEENMAKVGIYCLNFTTQLVEKFKKISYKKLYASSVNSHPGPLLTEQYAEFTYKELVNNGWLLNAEKRKNH